MCYLLLKFETLSLGGICRQCTLTNGLSKQFAETC